MKRLSYTQYDDRFLFENICTIIQTAFEVAP